MDISTLPARIVILTLLLLSATLASAQEGASVLDRNF